MDHGQLASTESLEKASAALAAHNFKPVTVKNRAEALEFIKKTIPQGASVMNGASTTLEQIGYIEYLKGGAHGWNNLHEAILAEKDPAKQSQLRKLSVVSDFYLGSAHAVTETGELVFASNSGSQLPHLAYTSPKVVLVVSTKKIVSSIAEAFDRIEKHIVPLEDVRMKKVYGYGTQHNKTLILHGENPALGRAVHVVFVREDLGF
ncbi:MAG TPA: lactate utilization protein [Candidatus Paceibacterota bacterium]|nr:lactate utilization protein [Candidatus Paceibacterota bacterium]